MNGTITALQSAYAEKEKELRKVTFELETLSNTINTAIHDETRAINNVLKNHMPEIVNIIHKHGLMCTSIKGIEHYSGDAIYTLQMHCYKVNLKAENGTIMLSFDFDNDGGGKRLGEIAKLVVADVKMFCEEHKQEVQTCEN